MASFLIGVMIGAFIGMILTSIIVVGADKK